MTSPVKTADPNHLSGAAICALGGCALGGTPGCAFQGGDLGGAFQGGVFGATVFFAAVVIGDSGDLPSDFPGVLASELELDAVERDFAMSPSEFEGRDFGKSAGGPADGPLHCLQGMPARNACLCRCSCRLMLLNCTTRGLLYGKPVIMSFFPALWPFCCPSHFGETFAIHLRNTRRNQ